MVIYAVNEYATILRRSMNIAICVSLLLYSLTNTLVYQNLDHLFQKPVIYGIFLYFTAVFHKIFKVTVLILVMCMLEHLSELTLNLILPVKLILLLIQFLLVQLLLKSCLEPSRKYSQLTVHNAFHFRNHICWSSLPFLLNNEVEVNIQAELVGLDNLCHIFLSLFDLFIWRSDQSRVQ